MQEQNLWKNVLYMIQTRTGKCKKLLKGAGLASKAKNLLNIIAENPFQNPPPYEGLVGNLNGYYSRRINIQHRLVYQVYNEPTVIDGIEI